MWWGVSFPGYPGNFLLGDQCIGHQEGNPDSQLAGFSGGRSAGSSGWPTTAVLGPRSGSVSSAVIPVRYRTVGRLSGAGSVRTVRQSLRAAAARWPGICVGVDLAGATAPGGSEWAI